MAFVTSTSVSSPFTRIVRPSICPTTARHSLQTTLRSRSAFQMTMAPSTDVSSARSSLPEQTVPQPLPNLYVYDHCPFCVRVRHVLGMKNIKYNLVWLMNDDAATPTSLVGKKMVPIFQPTGASGPSVPESLDICKLVDADPKFGQVGSVLPETGRTDISDVLDSIAMPLRRLTRVRFSRALLPEFTFESGRNAYIKNHPLSNPDSYDENFERSDEWIAAVQIGVNQLDPLIYSKESITEGGFSYDDVVTFAKLRALTMIKGLVIPPRVKEYVEWQAACCEIPLYYNYAV